MPVCRHVWRPTRGMTLWEPRVKRVRGFRDVTGALDTWTDAPNHAQTTMSPLKSTAPPGSLVQEERLSALLRPRTLVSSDSLEIECDSPLVEGEPDWDELAPDGWYAHSGRRCLDWALLVFALPLAALPMLTIAIVNWISHRSFSKILFTPGAHRLSRMRIYDLQIQDHEGRLRERNGLVVERKRRLASDALREISAQHALGRAAAALQHHPRRDGVHRTPSRDGRSRGVGREATTGNSQNAMCVHPGVTGWAQVTQGYTGRDIDAYRHKYEANARYTCRPTLLVDVEILLRTGVWILRCKGWDWQPSSEGNRGGHDSRRAIMNSE